MKEPLAAAQQVPLERLVRGQVGDGQGKARVVRVRLEESTDVGALECLLVDAWNFGWRTRW